MCSLYNAINLYREEADKEDNNKSFIIVRKVNGINTSLEDSDGNILYFDNMETAEIERIYYQPDYAELLKVVQINRD